MLGGHIAEQLRDRGHDVIAVVETPDLIGRPDEDILAAAAEQERCLVTLNVRDLAVLSAEWRRLGRTHAGIVHVATSAFPQDRSFVGAVVTSLTAAIQSGQLPADGQEYFLRRG